MPEHMPEDMPDRMPEDMSDRMPEDLPVRKCINVMVGIIRSEVILSHVESQERSGTESWTSLDEANKCTWPTNDPTGRHGEYHGKSP
jgi:hypothetical protein